MKGSGDYEANRFSVTVIVLMILLAVSGTPSAATGSATIRVTLLGTGTPFPSAERFGSAVLVEAAGKRLLFDCGRGAVIRLKQAGVSAKEIDGLFITHLHSDHVVGIPDLWLTGWFLGRDRPLRVLGPAGIRSLAEHLVQAFAFDVSIRREAPEHLPAKGAEIDAREIVQGNVYDDGPLRVSAFLVDHGPVKPAFGYRVDYQAHAVVISGDTKFCQNLIDFAHGADCLIHVAWAASEMNPTPPDKRILASAEDAGRVFAAVRPKLGIIYHYKDEPGLWDGVRKEYKGRFVIGTDLMVINVGKTVSLRGGSSGSKENLRR
jgi:ribonuclease Z